MMIVEQHDILFRKWAPMERCWHIETCHKKAAMAKLKAAYHNVKWWA
jgi:hypothetical protein